VTVTATARRTEPWRSGPVPFLAALLLVLTVGVSAVSADWLLVPFLGVKIDGQTNLIDIDQAAGAVKMATGVSVLLVGNGPIGVEADVGYLPGFFDSKERGGLVAHSNVTTLTGNVLVTVPASFSRDSLRPYVVGGVGLMHTGIGDRLDIFTVSSNFLALGVGGGAIGRLTPRTSLRFDLRRFQNLTEARGQVVGFGPSRLTFWRASVGLAFRY